MMGSATSRVPTSAATTFVQQVVSANPVVIFSKTYCPFCRMAKAVIGEYNVSPKVVELDTMPDGGDIEQALQHFTGVRTVPQVFVGGKLIGGGTDTQALHKNGQLRTLLVNAGALPA